MARIKWDEIGQRTYETGCDHGVLYPLSDAGVYDKGVAWNGLTAVNETPSGAEASPQYADNIKYLNLVSAEDLGVTIEAFTYPEEFGACDGSAEPTPGVRIGQQGRSMFGLCYRTIMGNDTKGQEYGYKLHLLYGCQAAPSEKAYQTINDSPEAIGFSWEVKTTPVPVTDYKPTALLTIESPTVDKTKLAALEAILYGADEPTSTARLPLPDEVITLLKTAAG